MKSFNDVRNNLIKENPELAHKLEVVGKIMAKRNESGMSQRELAKKSGVAQKTISRIENGINVPEIEKLTKLAAALDMTLDMARFHHSLQGFSE